MPGVDCAPQARGQAIGEDLHGEVRAAPDADGGADEREPRQRVLADLLHPEEADRREIEPGRHPRHHVAEEDSQQHVDHRHQHEDGDRDMRQPGDGAEDETHRGERSRCVRSCQTPRTLVEPRA